MCSSGDSREYLTVPSAHDASREAVARFSAELGGITSNPVVADAVTARMATNMARGIYCCHHVRYHRGAAIFVVAMGDGEMAWTLTGHSVERTGLRITAVPIIGDSLAGGLRRLTARLLDLATGSRHSSQTVLASLGSAGILRKRVKQSDDNEYIVVSGVRLMREFAEPVRASSPIVALLPALEAEFGALPCTTASSLATAGLGAFMLPGTKLSVRLSAGGPNWISLRAYMTDVPARMLTAWALPAGDVARALSVVVADAAATNAGDALYCQLMSAIDMAAAYGGCVPWLRAFDDFTIV